MSSQLFHLFHHTAENGRVTTFEPDNALACLGSINQHLINATLVFGVATRSFTHGNPFRFLRNKVEDSRTNQSVIKDNGSSSNEFLGFAG